MDFRPRVSDEKCPGAYMARAPAMRQDDPGACVADVVRYQDAAWVRSICSLVVFFLVQRDSEFLFPLIPVAHKEYFLNTVKTVIYCFLFCHEPHPIRCPRSAFCPSRRGGHDLRLCVRGRAPRDPGRDQKSSKCVGRTKFIFHNIEPLYLENPRGFFAVWGTDDFGGKFYLGEGWFAYLIISYGQFLESNFSWAVFFSF